MQVLPPANGKKLWRVKRTVSAGGNSSQDSNSSRECLNNSLKISAAGMDFMSRRPPARRPKSKSGERKDFVFVDLSPVKSETDALLPSDTSDVSSGSLGSPFQEAPSTFPSNVDSFSPASSIEDEFLRKSLASYDVSAAMGHGSAFDLSFLEDDLHYQCPTSKGPLQQQTPYDFAGVYGFYQQPPCHSCHMHNFPQYYTMRAPGQVPCWHGDESLVAPLTHRRTQSATVVPTRNFASGCHSNIYQAPCSVRKPASRKMRRTLSQPAENILASLMKEPVSGTGQECTPQSEYCFPQTPCLPNTFAANPTPEVDYFSDFSLTDLDMCTDMGSVQYSPLTEYSDPDTKDFYGSKDTDALAFEDLCALNKESSDLSSLLAL